MFLAALQDLKARLTARTSCAIKRDFLIPQSAIVTLSLSKGRIPQSKGFTLIETIITLVVLSIAAVGVLSVFTTSIRGSANPLIINQAIQLAQGEMDQVVGERLKSGGFDSLAPGASVACTTSMLSGFTCNRAICYVPSGNLNATAPCQTAVATDYKHVTVTITEATIGSVSLDTVVANY